PSAGASFLLAASRRRLSGCRSLSHLAHSPICSSRSVGRESEPSACPHACRSRGPRPDRPPSLGRGDEPLAAGGSPDRHSQDGPRSELQRTMRTGSRDSIIFGQRYPTGETCERLQTMNTLRGVILDVDGTLVDSNGAHTHAWVEALGESGV